MVMKKVIKNIKTLTFIISMKIYIMIPAILLNVMIPVILIMEFITNFSMEIIEEENKICVVALVLVF
jgi:hypothetical protein